jgi:serine O-acetyltransferase
MDRKVLIKQLFDKNRESFAGFPNKRQAEEFINGLFHLLFTPYHGCYANENEVEIAFEKLELQFIHLLETTIASDEERDQLRQRFFHKLPELYQGCLKDAEAILQFDPAAFSLEEILITYPGFFATAVYRIAHWLWELKVPVLPRLFTEFAHRQTGIDIHPGAEIGEAFAIDHGTGIVIGETAVIGNSVKIYQGVTLGALNVAKSNANKKRHPTIQDHVVIYSGATILGGETVVGSNSIIGGNVWLTYSVPAHSVVYQLSEVKIRDKNPFPEPINFSI